MRRPIQNSDITKEAKLKREGFSMPMYLAVTVVNSTEMVDIDS